MGQMAARLCGCAVLLCVIGVAPTASAQQQPAPPPQPYPQQAPGQTPQQSAVIATTSSPELDPWKQKLVPLWPYVALHTFCAYPEDNVSCGGGVGIGIRYTGIINKRGDGVGAAIDYRAGANIGFGSTRGEGASSITTNHASGLVEVGIGPALRAGTTELITAFGGGAEGVWLDTQYDEDLSHGEGYLYMMFVARFDVGDYVRLAPSFARKLETFDWYRTYENRFEASVRFHEWWQPTIHAWFSRNTDYLVGGVAFSGAVPVENPDKRRR